MEQPLVKPKGEFHISGAGRALKFWGGVFICLMSLAAFFTLHWLIGNIVWLIGAIIIVKQIYVNYNEFKTSSEKVIPLFNLILKVLFLLAVLGLILFIDITFFKVK